MLSTLLSILLLILKIIGILFLVILGIILIVLLVPIRYQFALSDKAEEKLNAQAGISWFLSILSIHIQYAEKKIIYYLKIAGFTLRTNDSEYLRKKREKKIEKTRKKRAAQKKKAGTQNHSSSQEAKKDSVKKPSDPSLMQEEPKPAQKKEGSIMAEEKPALAETVKVEQAKKVTSPSEADSQKISKNESKKEKKKKRKKTDREASKKDDDKKEEKPSILERMESKMDGIGQKMDGLGEKIEQIKEKAEEFQVFKVLQILKTAVFRVLKHILPRKLEGWLRFGFDDPSLTGKATAAAAVFYPYYRKSFTLEPDFQEKCLEGNCSGKGLIRLGYLLWILIYLLLKKEIRKIIIFILKNR